MSLLPLPATPRDLISLARSVLPRCFVPAMCTDAAVLMLAATALYESGGKTRVQFNGPARGLSQLQENYIADIAANDASASLLIRACDALGVPYAPRKIYGRLTSRDDLCFAIDRLGFWCDPAPLPNAGDGAGAWACYLRVHQPGKPDENRWSGYAYPLALEALQAA